MKTYSSSSRQTNIPIGVLLADDDEDDQYFFTKALKNISIPTKLYTVDDGEDLISFLLNDLNNLPEVIFLDLNMPRKNGLQCLIEIKDHEKLKVLPVIIYSTYMDEKNVEILYDQGADYYIGKTNITELSEVLQLILNLLIEQAFVRPTKEEFIVFSKSLKASN